MTFVPCVPRWHVGLVCGQLAPRVEATKINSLRELTTLWLISPGRFLQQLLAAGEARIDLVPVSHLRLALTPAQADLAAVHPAREIHQAHEEILQLDTELAQLLDELAHPFAAALELVFQTQLFLALEVSDPRLAFAQLVGQLGNILDNAAHERQHRVGLRRGEILLARNGLSGSHRLASLAAGVLSG